MSRACILPGVGLVLLLGCQQPGARVQADNPGLAAYIQLLMPTRIEIQPFWTKVVSLAGTGQVDGLEVVLGAYDSFGDNTKLVGTLHFEVYARRLASAERRDNRLAFWPVNLDTKEQLTTYWDPALRLYVFPLRLEQPNLAPGAYILTARLQTPTGDRLQDEYELTVDSGPAPPARGY